MLLTIGAAIIVLGVLIFVHELGHFIAAKAVGVGVPRFSLGLGPVSPIRWRRGETEYVISWIPFGGYVKMATAEDEDQVMGSLEGGVTQEKYPPEKLFENKPLAARILVIVAGVTMNIIFAWVVYSGLFAAYGGPVPSTPAIARVDSAGLPPAASALAAIPFGTQITRVNGDTVTSWTDVYGAILDPTIDALEFEFAGQPSISVPLSDQDTDEREGILRSIRPLQEARIGALVPGYPAERAGLKSGDLVVAIGQDSVRSWEELLRAVEGRAGDTISIALRRDETILHIPVVPVAETVADTATGGTRSTGRIGVQPPRMRYGVGGALVQGARETAGAAGDVWFAVKGLVTGKISPKALGGPIQIGQLSGQVARMGLDRFLTFMAFFSVNLAILNLLPIPVLDGGHLLFLIIEGIARRPLSLKVRLRLSQMGMVFLIGLMLYAVTNDLMRIFSP